MNQSLTSEQFKYAASAMRQHLASCAISGIQRDCCELVLKRSLDIERESAYLPFLYFPRYCERSRTQARAALSAMKLNHVLIQKYDNAWSLNDPLFWKLRRRDLVGAIWEQLEFESAHQPDLHDAMRLNCLHRLSVGTAGKPSTTPLFRADDRKTVHDAAFPTASEQLVGNFLNGVSSNKYGATSNIQHRTSNIEQFLLEGTQCPPLRIPPAGTFKPDFKALKATASVTSSQQTSKASKLSRENLFMDGLREFFPPVSQKLFQEKPFAIHDGGKWRDRFRGEPGRCERLLGELREMIKNAERDGRAPFNVSAAACAEQLWKQTIF